MTVIHTVDALSGAGKTYAAARHAHRMAQRGRKLLIVQPSLTLIDQTLADLASLSPAVAHRAIHGGTSANVVGDIVAHSKACGQGGEVLLITHAAFMRLPYFDRRADWDVIVDEIPQADWCEEFRIPNTHRLVTDWIEIDPEARNLADNRYVRAFPSSRPALETMARNTQGDQVWDIFQQFANVLLSDHWAAYVLDDQYQNLLAGQGERRSLLAFAVLRPTLFEGFASATVMGANLKESMLYHLWLAQGVEFRRHKALTAGLRYAEHGNGRLLTVRYASEEDWSKTYRDKPAVAGEPATVFDRVVESVLAAIGDEPFAWMANKDVEDPFTGRGTRLPNSPHGLNSFQHIHNAVVLSALNPPPAHFTFLETPGLNSEEVRRAGVRQAVYQAAMRISLRNPADLSPKQVIVMDRATADWLADLFPGCTVEPLAGLVAMPAKGKPGRTRRHVCDADRKAAHRHRYKLELEAALDLVNGSERVLGRAPHLAADLRRQMTEFGRGRDESLSAMGRADLHAMGGTLFASIYSREPFEAMERGDADTFIEALRRLHATALPAKEESGLISPAIFDPALSAETSRGLDNVRAVWGIWLDNDGGDLGHEAFARLFPRLRMVICNSYSSTPQAPRWRVFIPTTCAMSLAAYRAIAGQIMLTLNRAGYWSDRQLADNPRIRSRLRHGFDMSKLVPSSLFYLPCQAKRPEGSFFVDHDDARRAPLDPFAWAGYAANRARPEPAPVAAAPAPPQPSVEPIPMRVSPAKRAAMEKLRAERDRGFAAERARRREEAVAAWRQSPAGTGHEAFFRLALGLVRAGLPLPEVMATLHQEASFARHPEERRREIKDIVRTLTKRCGAKAA